LVRVQLPSQLFIGILSFAEIIFHFLFFFTKEKGRVVCVETKWRYITKDWEFEATTIENMLGVWILPPVLLIFSAN
jgi:hypothetical protein